MGIPGINTQLGEVALEGLASTSGMVIRSATLATASRDVGNAVTTNIRKYMALGLDATGTTYSPYDSTNHVESEIVVLLEEVRDIDHGDATVEVLYHGVMKHDYVITPTSSAAITWANVQRIAIAPVN